MGRILALDLGERNTGLAITDDTQTIAYPIDYTVGPRELIKVLKDLVVEQEVELIVVGRPLTMAGEAGVQSDSVDRMSEKIKASLSIPLVFLDERLTTKQAEMMKSMFPGVPVDSIAAYLLLEHYLQARKNK